MIASSSNASSPVRKRSIVIAGHKTSVSMEDGFWDALREIAAASKRTLTQVVSEIDGDRSQGNLSSALRLFILSHYQARAAR
ncbi:ribbon-helix-helix domain-containing protein [Ancylobacter sp.]|uniref:ribbon-helix-helix domain-containing protein n=1 Tax=Ancylobacter sp. TaxID=1872567 RepID=UPI003D096556